MDTKKVKEALEIINDAILEVNNGNTYAEDFYWWRAVLNTFDYDVKEGQIIPYSKKKNRKEENI